MGVLLPLLVFAGNPVVVVCDTFHGVVVGTIVTKFNILFVVIFTSNSCVSNA